MLLGDPYCFFLSTEVNIAMLQDFETWETVPTRSSTWQTCRERLLRTVLG